MLQGRCALLKRASGQSIKTINKELFTTYFTSNNLLRKFLTSRLHYKLKITSFTRSLPDKIFEIQSVENHTVCIIMLWLAIAIHNYLVADKSIIHPHTYQYVYLHYVQFNLFNEITELWMLAYTLCKKKNKAKKNLLCQSSKFQS